MSNTSAQCSMDNIYVQWTFAYPLDPMVNDNVQWTFIYLFIYLFTDLPLKNLQNITI